ncbi:uncharacterized protein LOC110696211 [Chenopodium quinoa]|uniref:uncharacterized protein LOC110696211 n=1 Tax=Chenopodium quinoa TaxID=63459 RepID=UPI000B77FCC7|nr:uncharacterized protein LOC110696211 [Chenopodium quinoa]
MGPKLGDQLASTPPKLSLTNLPSLKGIAPESPWTLTPPLHPMASIPFKWEEAPGKPRFTNSSSPCKKPKSVRCLELPPRMLVEGLEAKVAHMPSSPTAVLDGPSLGRSLSQRFCFEGPILNASPVLGLNVKENSVMGQGKSKKKDVKRQIGPWKRWASGNGTKWNQKLYKGNSGISPWSDSIEGSDVMNEKDIEVKVTRFRRRSKRSLHKLSNTSSRVFENILECLKQIVVRRRKEEKQRYEAS